MNLLEAMVIVRNLANIANHSELYRSPQGKAALKVVNKKIASLERKQAWRESIGGEMPDHAKYPDHPLNKL